jgi:hypothetical protein
VGRSILSAAAPEGQDGIKRLPTCSSLSASGPKSAVARIQLLEQYGHPVRMMEL